MIAVVAPSTCVERKLLLEGAAKLAGWGHPVCFDERIHKTERFLAGSDKDRAESLLFAAQNPLVRGIWCARGGYGVTRLLPLLDKLNLARQFRQDPKPLLGYSDITALHLYLYQKIGLKSVHAPLIATTKFLNLPKATEKILQKILLGTLELGKNSYTARWATRPLAPIKKDITGILLGGNLTLLANLAGTPWQPDLRGSILLIEDCGEAPYRIDRLLTQLWNADMLKGVRAVAAGDLSADVVRKKGEKKDAWKDVLRDRLVNRGIPVIYGLPVGHAKKNEPLPLGVRARLTRHGRLELLEQAVR